MSAMSQMSLVLHSVSQTVPALMEKWSAEQLPALVSDFTINCTFECTFTCVSPCLSLFFLLSAIVSHSLCLSLSFILCVFSQWTVAGAAGPSGALAVGRVMLV